MGTWIRLLLLLIFFFLTQGLLFGSLYPQMCYPPASASGWARTLGVFQYMAQWLLSEVLETHVPALRSTLERFASVFHGSERPLRPASHRPFKTSFYCLFTEITHPSYFCALVTLWDKLAVLALPPPSQNTFSEAGEMAQ